MSTRSRLLTGLVVLALLVTIGVLVLRPDAPAPGPAPAASPASEPWELTDLPGDVRDPGPLALPAPGEGDPISVRFEARDGAVGTAGLTGLSFDATELANPAWASDTSNLALTLAELDRPVLRFGGNGVDRRMWWTSDDEPAPDWAEATVTPADLERVAAVADRVDATVTLALDLGHDDPARAADMAAHARAAFGDRLLAVAVGNEPNGYHHAGQPDLEIRGEDWDPAAYQVSLAEYAAAIEETAPGLPVAGPGAYDAPWWRAFAEAEVPAEAALTLHWYPLWDCAGPASSIANPTVEDLTSPALRERARTVLGMGAEVAAEHDLPLWIEETGPTSCPGTNDTSRTHAQALWTVDYALTAAETGAERLAFHSTLGACRGGAPMSPVCATGTVAEPGELVRGRTSFLALMLLGRLPDGRVLAPTVSGDGRIMVHGVLGDDDGLTLVMVDLRDPADGEAVAAVSVSAPEGIAEDGPSAWTVARGSVLGGEALEATESTLTEPAPVSGPLAGAGLGRGEPLVLGSAPGSVTVMELEVAGDGRAASDGGR